MHRRWLLFGFVCGMTLAHTALLGRTPLSILTLNGRQVRGFSLREKTHVRGANGHVQRNPSLRILNCISLGPSVLAAQPSADTRVASTAEAAVTETDIFVSGQGGYDTYRIPSLVATQQGTLLAFCEGRKTSRSDAGDIDLLLRRSTDRGDHWSDVQVVWDDGPNTCGNPCVVVDRTTGVVWLLLTWNSGTVPERRIQSGFGADSRRVFVTRSKDDGKTWPVARQLYAGSSAYCCLCTIAPDRVGCLYEKDDYQRIVLARFPLAWLTPATAPSAR